jgi:hypothetical protein
MDLQTLVNEAKELFNNYSQAKDLYSQNPANKTLMENCLTQFLVKTLDVCRDLASKTESGAERDLFRRFARELNEIFK